MFFIIDRRSLRRSALRLLFLLLLLCPVGNGAFLRSQESLKRESWKEVVEGQDFKENYTSLEEPNVKNPSMLKIPPFLGNLMRVLLYGLLFLLLGFLLFLLLRMLVRTGRIGGKGKDLKYTINNFEDHLPNVDLHALLEEALARDDYRLAFRVRFLMLIQQLNEQGLIRWKKDKTNGVYVREMKGHPAFNDFVRVTNWFDSVWYGNHPVSPSVYNHIGPFIEIVERSVTVSSNC